MKIVKKFLNDNPCDKSILFMCLALMAFGLLLQLSIGSSRGTEHSLQYFQMQLKWALISLPIMLLISRIKNIFSLINKVSFLLILLSIIALVLVLAIGTTQKGGTRWLRFGGIGLQPSMPASIILILYTAKFIHKKYLYIERSTLFNFIKDFLPLLIICALVFGLIYAEKHLSTLIVLGIAILSMFFVANIRFSTLFILIVLIGGLALFTIKHGQESYRSSRMDMFSQYSLYHKLFNIKVSDTNDDAYQIKESLTAISSGHIFGTGPSKGRAKHYFLPDAKSDYIFAIIAEEYGFVGGLIVIVIYTLIFLKSCTIAWKTKNLYLQLVGIGLALNFFLPAMVNTGVSISALPPTGLTMPFLSYGGTSFFFIAVNMGLILNLSTFEEGDI
ncbi:MAG: FtsW/RodA/SpoVE family cell cycle protein [Candidatus Cloacimonadales bacterium]|jgi:cell division protein FtsW|nr:FtsW/RodA/SpoVE family cell cycle protein [Candidatus Cloacimonadales bacterium]